jgi:hypothetical protein
MYVLGYTNGADDTVYQYTLGPLLGMYATATDAGLNVKVWVLQGRNPHMELAL